MCSCQSNRTSVKQAPGPEYVPHLTKLSPGRFGGDLSSKSPVVVVDVVVVVLLVTVVCLASLNCVAGVTSVTRSSVSELRGSLSEVMLVVVVSAPRTCVGSVMVQGIETMAQGVETPNMRSEVFRLPVVVVVLVLLVQGDEIPSKQCEKFQ